MKARRKAREAALRVLYMMDVAGVSAEEALRGYWSQLAEDREGESYGTELVRSYAAHAEEVDDLIRQVSHHWRLERMARVDRNILRLGASELMRGDVPQRVVLNEAVELAKRYGAEGSAGFVNGILDNCASRLRKRTSDD